MSPQLTREEEAKVKYPSRFFLGLRSRRRKF
jgi:hypothetical protein